MQCGEVWAGRPDIVADMGRVIQSVAPAELNKNHKNLTENKKFCDGGVGGGSGDPGTVSLMGSSGPS